VTASGASFLEEEHIQNIVWAYLCFQERRFRAGRRPSVFIQPGESEHCLYVRSKNGNGAKHSKEMDIEAIQIGSKLTKMLDQ
jgi:hypothetical protein